MKKNRIIWICILGVLLVNSLLSTGLTGICILGGAVCITIVSCGYVLLGNQKITAEIKLPSGAAKCEQVEGTVILDTESSLPVFKAEVHLTVKNLRTGECEVMEMGTGLTGKEPETLKFHLENQLCGYVEIFIESVTVYDALGLFKKDVKVDGKGRIHIIPDTFAMDVALVTSYLTSDDSVEYSREKAGNDVSEIFGIREYVPGDSIKNIHWKLTSKCDDVMVKLPSLPLESSVLLMVENGYEEGKGPSPYAVDALTESFITLSQTLMDNNINHQVVWYDYEHERVFSFNVEDEEDLHSVMGRILETGLAADGESAASHYIKDGERFDKAHVVYLSTCCKGGLNQIPSDITVTAVICSDGEESLPDGINGYTCTYRDYIRELRNIEI